VPAGVFFVAQKLTTGSFLPNPVLQENSFALSLFSPLLLLLKVLQVSYWLFIAQFRFIISIFIAIAYIKYRSEVELKEILLFKIMVLFFIIPFIVIFFMARYILPILPFFYIIGAASITSIFNNRNIRLSIAAACIVSFSLLLTGKSKEYRNYEVNMQYIDIVNIYREAGKHLEDRAMTGKVFAPWPLDEIYCKPHLGYVTKPVSMAQDVFDADILIYSRHSDYHASRYLEQVISLNHLKPCRKIEQKGKLIELYCLNDDDKKNIMKNKVFYHAEAPSPALPMTNYLIKIRDYFGE
jgi:hypothetical protein